MSRTILMLIALFVVVGVHHDAGAVQITLGGCAAAAAGDGQTSCVAGASVTDFNGSTTLAGNYVGTATVQNGSSGIAAELAGDTSNYLAVATATSTGSELISYTKTYNYFGLYWGSVDSYNSVVAYLNGQVVGTVAGADVLGAGGAFGDQHSASANEYVNLTFATGYNQIALVSNGYNFEVDNVAAATVPEPATGRLLALGVTCLLVGRRKAR